eukprot:1159002-Pelagomonas_calceolata.AAC.12
MSRASVNGARLKDSKKLCNPPKNCKSWKQKLWQCFSQKKQTRHYEGGVLKFSETKFLNRAEPSVNAV